MVCNPYGTAQYLTAAYCAKADAPDSVTLNKQMMEYLSRERDMGIPEITSKKLYLASMAIVHVTQTSAQEAAWFLLGFPIVICTKKVVSFNPTPPHKRPQYFYNENEVDEMVMNEEQVRMLRKKKEVDEHVRDYMSLQLDDFSRKDDFSLWDFLTEYSASQKKDKAVEEEEEGPSERYADLDAADEDELEEAPVEMFQHVDNSGSAPKSRTDDLKGKGIFVHLERKDWRVVT